MAGVLNDRIKGQPPGGVPIHPEIQKSIHPIIRWFVVAGFGAGNKKTHSRCQPWVLVKLVSISTRADGVADYDDYQRNLSNCSVHCEAKISIQPPWVKSTCGW